MKRARPTARPSEPARALHFPKPAILDRIPRDRHAVIEASAGTGKTYTIEHLVVDRLLVDRVPLDQILVLTYTEKAAAELRRRIRALIDRMLAATTDCVTPGEACWLLDQPARDCLERALLDFDLATIDTMHAFFQRVLAENAFSSGRLFAQVLDDGQALFSRAFGTALRRTFARVDEHKQYLTCWLERNTVEELDALLYKCHRARRRLRPEYRPQELQALLADSPLRTVDENVLDDLRTAFKAAKIHANTSKAMVDRFRKLAAIVMDYERDLSLPRFLLGYDAEWLEMICKNLNGKPLPAGIVQDLAEHIQALQQQLVSFQAAIVQTFLPKVRQLLHDEKEAYGFYDFDDMIALVWESLEGPHGANLLRTLRRQYRYGLVDEFQDTDDLQWNIFHRIFVDSDRENLLYLIGDPKQAIYAFRGADVYTYLSAREEITQTEGDGPVPLVENFRSTSALLEAHNLIFQQEAEEPFFQGPIRYDVPVCCGRTDLIVQDQTGALVEPVCLVQITPEGDKLSASAFRRALGRHIARTLRRLLTTPEGSLYLGTAGNLKHVEARDVFILTATNQEGYEIGKYLREAGVPHAFYKQEGLFQTAEAHDVADLLAAVDDPQDRSRRFKAWLTPFFAVPLPALPDCMDLLPDHALLNHLLAWKELAARRDFEGLFAGFLEHSGVIRRELFLRDSEREITNYLHIFEILLEETQRSGCDLAELLRTLRAFIAKERSPAGESGNVQRLESERAAVQIMTIHRSKGLEAAVVFVYGGLTSATRFQGHLFPYQQEGKRVLHIGENKSAETEAGEERCREYQRLLYVALTRAKARLYLPIADPNLWKKWDGCYKQLNLRLDTLFREHAEGRHAGLFAVAPVHEDAPTRRVREGRRARLTDWVPDAELLAENDDEALFARLRRRHAGFEVTSYTRIKQAGGGYVAPREAREFQEDAARFAPEWLPETTLPGGAAVGTFLHELLETLPFTTFDGKPTLDAWRADPTIGKWFAQALARHGIDRVHREESQRLIYNALTATVPLGGDDVVPGLCSCTRKRHEVEFLFPFPEKAHPRLTQLPRDEFVIERGYVKGFVDFLFEHGGRVYFADWKSDVLPDYGDRAIAEHVQRNYYLQVKLYSLALVKMLAVHSEAEYDARFGGLVYCFLRGMRPGGAPPAGTYFTRPSWSDILAFEQELVASRATPEERG